MPPARDQLPSIDTPAARACLAAVRTPATALSRAEASLAELADLARTLGLTVHGTMLQTRDTPHSRSYIGSGKLAELRQLVNQQQAELVIFDNDLSPRQGQIIERALGCMVWDRTQLILEIFARHAATAEARAQVELARLKYTLPRLVGLWAHLDRERGGISASRGMGEKQVAVDRRIIQRRIQRLQQDLARRETSSATRRKQRQHCLQAALIGYTNAGKSTLMNALTGSRVTVANRLFATLDATTRVLDDSIDPALLLSDTVGFIRNLPHDLVASFHATLAVAREADLLVQVADISDPSYREHLHTTDQVLRQIGAHHLPRLLVCNKADRLADDFQRLVMAQRHPDALVICARDASDIALLRQRIISVCRRTLHHRTVRLPYDACSCIADIERLGRINAIEYRDDAIYIDCSLSPASRSHLQHLLDRHTPEA